MIADDLAMHVARASANMVLTYPDSKIHGANIGSTWVLLAPGGPHVGPMKLAMKVVSPEYSRTQPLKV